MTWLETASETFVARYDERDADDAERVLAQLEYARERLQRKLDVQLGDLSVVLHPTSAQLDAAQPWLPLQRARTAPAARRYVVGTVTEEEIHVLAPRVLAQRASNVEGSLELLMLAPSALLAKRMLRRQAAPVAQAGAPWRLEGAAQFFSGQIKHIRPVVVLRIHERPAPSFPPGRRDALLLGGTVFDLLHREEGDEACLELASAPDPAAGARAGLPRPPVPPDRAGLALAPQPAGAARLADDRGRAGVLDVDLRRARAVGRGGPDVDAEVVEQALVVEPLELVVDRAASRRARRRRRSRDRARAGASGPGCRRSASCSAMRVPSGDSDGHSTLSWITCAVRSLTLPLIR